jgi:hypothetical protein
MRGNPIVLWVISVLMLLVGCGIGASIDTRTRAEEQKAPPYWATATWSFAVADYNGDGIPDVYAIKRTGTGSGKTEVHVLNGRKGFKEWIAHEVTVLEETPDVVMPITPEKVGQ